ncbi:MAG: hypothetical protein ACREO0_08025 [Pseudoxanthomonas sp.]
MNGFGWIACLVVSACATGCAGIASNSRAEAAYVRDHPMVSPRVPLYRLDDDRRVDIELVDTGSRSQRMWFVDPARDVDSPLDPSADPECPHASFGLPGMFDGYESGATHAPIPRHYQFDDPEVLVFADKGLAKTWFSAAGKKDGGIGLRLMLSTDGGRSFSWRELIMETPYRWLPAQQRYDYSDKLVSFSTTYSAIRFLLVRNQMAYLGMGRVDPRVQSGLSRSDINREYPGDPVAVFAFDPRYRGDEIPVRLLQGHELRSFGLPNPAATAHAVDRAVLDRIRIPNNGVTYDQAARRQYVESLRSEFPDWAAKQNIKIGRPRYETNRERINSIDEAAAQGDRCARYE